MNGIDQTVFTTKANGRRLMTNLRLGMFYRLMHPYSDRKRRNRAQWFVDTMGIWPNMKIVDLGGAPRIWQHVTTPLNITMINLEFSDFDIASIDQAKQHQFAFVKGDACDVGEPSNSFDLVFSNSVIEHVGDARKRAAFAKEARRLAPKYWIQTPAKSFPIEAHNGMPFWWYYPESVRRSLKDKWRKSLPAWTEMIDGTTVVEKPELKLLFPEASMISERVLGMVKSNIAYRA
jgi:hypothetical protein